MLAAYLADLEARGKSPKTLRTYRGQLQKFLAWLQESTGSGDPTKITAIDAVAYRSHLQDRGLKPSSVNTALAAIEAFCAWLTDNRHMDHNPLAKVQRIAQVTEPPKWLDKNQKYRVIRAALQEPQKRNQAILLTLLMAGLRAGELVALRPNSVALSDRKGSITVEVGKGNKRRVVPIPKDLRDCLQEYMADLPADAPWLFPSQRGVQLTYIGVHQLCTALGDKAKVPDLTPHVLRHTYGHDLVVAGTPIDMVAKLMGHAKIDTTRIYTQPGAQELQTAVEKLSFT